MLKIKPFLFALCLSPLSLMAFNSPVRAQANFTTSQGQAGTPSGVNIGASGTTVFSSPANSGNSNNASTQVLVNAAQVSAVGAASTAVLQTLAADGSVASSTTLVLISSDRPLAAFGITNGLANAATAIANAPTTGTTTRTVAGVTVTASAATATTGQTFSASRGGISLGSIVTPTATTAGSVTVGGVTIDIPPIANPTRAAQATQASIAVLLAGGSANQAAASAQIAGTGAGVGASVRLVAALANLIPSTFDPNASNPLVPNLNASRMKSLELAKELILAQGEAGTINPAQLAEAIIAYNEVIDSSTPEVVAELSKNKSFVQIGETLRKLRAAFGE
jgi:hypothetical protein